MVPIEADEGVVQKILDEGSQCGICLQEISKTDSKPIVLKDCHHAFCFSCLKQWNDFQSKIDFTAGHPPQNKGPTCPMCRRAMPDISKTSMQNALNLMGQARKESDPDKCRTLCDQAQEQISQVVKETENSTNPSLRDRVQLAVIQGEVALFTHDYEKAIYIFQEASNLLEHAVELNQTLTKLMEKIDGMRHSEDSNVQDECEKLLDEAAGMVNQERSQPDQYVSMILKVGQAQRLAKKWTDAKKTYQELASRWIDDATPPQSREIFTSMSECAYHLGRNDIAIDLGEGAIEMNRYFPWSHKFVALAKKAEGDLEGAKQVAAEAVIYETPWDEKHKMEVQGWFRENFM